MGRYVPTADSETLGWWTDTSGNTNLYQSIDDASVSDTDYVTPKTPVTDDAEMILEARTYSGVGALRDWSDNGHHAYFRYLELGGTSDYAKGATIHTTSLTDPDVRFSGIPDDYTPSGFMVMVMGRTTDQDGGFDFGLNTDGTLRLLRFTAGPTQRAVNSTVAAPTTAHHFRAVLNTSAQNIHFYTSDESPTLDYDEVTWTQLGATVADFNGAVVHGTNFPYTIGATEVGSYGFAGKVFRAEVRQRDATIPEFHVDFQNAKAGDATIPERYGDTVTLYNNAAIIHTAHVLPYDNINYYWVPGRTDSTSDASEINLSITKTPTSQLIVEMMVYLDSSRWSGQNWWAGHSYLFYTRVHKPSKAPLIYWRESDETAHSSSGVAIADSDLFDQPISIKWVIDWDGSTNYTVTHYVRQGLTGAYTQNDQDTVAATGAGGFKQMTGIYHHENQDRREDLRVYGGSVTIDGITIAKISPSDIEPSRTALDLDGVSDDANVPDETALQIEGNIEIEVDAALEWSHSNGKIIEKGTNYGDYAYYFYTGDFYGGGHLGIAVSDNGNGYLFYESPVAVQLVDDTRHTVKVSFIPDNGTNSVARFYVDNILINEILATPLSGIYPGTDDLQIGTSLPGQFFKVTIRDNGNTVFDADFANQKPGTSTVTAETGQTVTLNADAAIVPDGQLRIHDSTPTYLDLDGTSDSAYMPTNPFSSVSTTMDVRVRATKADWQEATWRFLAGDTTVSATGTKAGVGLHTSGGNGVLMFIASDGTAHTNYYSTTANTFGDGTTNWLRYLYDATNDTVDFYVSSDDTNDPTAVSWTQLGTQVAATRNLNTSASNAFYVGRYVGYDSNTWPGQVHRVWIEDDGDVVVDTDFTNLAPGVTAFTDNAGNDYISLISDAAIAGGSNKWDVQRANTGYVTTLVSHTTIPLSGPNYITVVDDTNLNFDASTDSFTVLAYVLTHNENQGTSKTIMLKGSTPPYYRLYTEAAYDPDAFGGHIHDNTNQDWAPGGATGAEMYENHPVVSGFTSVPGTMQGFYNGTMLATSSNSVGDLSNTLPMRIGWTSNGFEGEYYALYVWRKKLSDTEVKEATALLLSPPTNPGAE